MARKSLLLAVLAISIGVIAQQPMSPNQAQAPPNVIAVSPPPTVLVVGGGLYGPSVFMAPTANFATPQPAAGASVSVTGQAGISLNTQPYLGVTSTLGPAPLVYESGEPGYAYTPAAGANAAGTAPASGRLINDMGPSYYEGAVEAAAAAPSLGEVAAQYRSAPPHPIRIYTNADGERLARTVVISGVPVATNMPPPVPQPAPAQNTAPQTQQASPADQNATTPQINPAPQTSDQSQKKGQLPATSTLLPLLSVLGLLSTGAGLWVRRIWR
jgi:hypothetical protein